MSHQLFAFFSPVPRHIFELIESVVRASCDAGRHRLGRTWLLRRKVLTIANTTTGIPVSCGTPPSFLNPTVDPTAEAAFGYVVKYTCTCWSSYQWPLHLQPPPPPTSLHPRIVLPVSTHRYTHIRPEVVGWAPPV